MCVTVEKVDPSIEIHSPEGSETGSNHGDSAETNMAADDTLVAAETSESVTPPASPSPNHLSPSYLAHAGFFTDTHRVSQTVHFIIKA